MLTTWMIWKHTVSCTSAPIHVCLCKHVAPNCAVSGHVDMPQAQSRCAISCNFLLWSMLKKVYGGLGLNPICICGWAYLSKTPGGSMWCIVGLPPNLINSPNRMLSSTVACLPSLHYDCASAGASFTRSCNAAWRVPPSARDLSTHS